MYSGSFDNSIIVWDIGGGKGTALELQGHHSKVIGLGCISHSKRLFSVSNDGILGIWDMAAKRDEVQHTFKYSGLNCLELVVKIFECVEDLFISTRCWKLQLPL